MVDISFTMVMQWINFGILLYILNELVFKKLIAFMDARSKGIAANIEEALNNKEKSLALLEEYNTKLRDIKHEANTLFDATRKQAENERKRIMEAAQREATAMVDSAREEIKREAAIAKESIKREVTALVVQCASKVIEREVKEHDHKHFIDEFIAQEK